MQRTQIYLHPDQHRALLNEARRKGISLAELIRQIVSEHLERRGGRKAPKEAFLRIIGMGASGRNDVSERHDYYLAEALDRDHNG
ncbi:CopG family transcriptional regulator [Desulfofundulus thermosubterraneus]|uniref:Ribbon-helix-helix protein, copG family n=1 Tax=Desulfofundulus thermosubterraneus DSM 16057 TaxID=1121432 RepID=A0A1M6I021_9FIRM|nr:CopG family transcriptional regulator [Desulfofundulus thermosubterraneus]SHJ27859.1 Ribbon-helix-helix protein, copG family [Desulfofundulus thermosubterraneus DSM 16057]